jgi:hypothetical protein
MVTLSLSLFRFKSAKNKTKKGDSSDSLSSINASRRCDVTELESIEREIHIFLLSVDSFGDGDLFCAEPEVQRSLARAASNRKIELLKNLEMVAAADVQRAKELKSRLMDSNY